MYFILLPSNPGPCCWCMMLMLALLWDFYVCLHLDTAWQRHTDANHGDALVPCPGWCHHWHAPLPFMVLWLLPCYQAPSYAPRPLSSRAESSVEDPSSWRLGLRKTGSSSAVPERTSITRDKEADKLARSASSPWLAGESSASSRLVSYKNIMAEMKCSILFFFHL